MPSFKKFTQIQNPPTSKLIVFLDVHEDSIVDSHFGIPTLAYTSRPNQWWDVPANRHDQGCTLSFADGHAERWKWKVPKAVRGMLRMVAADEWSDYDRVQAGVRQTW